MDCPLNVYYITLCVPLDPNVKESIIAVLKLQLNYIHIQYTVIHNFVILL